MARGWDVKHFIYLSIGILCSLAGCSLPVPLQPATLEQRALWVSGQDGYHTYRIPSLAVTRRGTVLAFCEGRKTGGGDSGDIDLLLKRGPDGGRTWEPRRVVFDDGPNTVGNPCPVVDRTTGTIWLLLTHNLGEDAESEIVAGTSVGSRSVWVSRSDDDGRTWTAPVDITTAVKRPDWTWYATGPGCGIQMKTGRLVIPCDHVVAGSKLGGSHVIFSDDHGATWQLGGAVDQHVNECQVVERADDKLLLNMRNPLKDAERHNRRAWALSGDGGLTWSDVFYEPLLIEPVCQASFVRLTSPPWQQSRLLFANPASQKRERMTVRLSLDQGNTWPIAKELYAGPSAYSALAVLPDKRIACLYECGEKKPYETITLAQFSLRWLMQ